MEVVVTTGLLELQFVQSSSQIITNKPTSSFFYRPDAIPVAQPTVSKHWRENYHIPWTCLRQAHLGVFQLCLWPLIAPGYLGGGLPCLSSALWCQYPNVILILNQHGPGSALVCNPLALTECWEVPHWGKLQSENTQSTNASKSRQEAEIEGENK